MQHPNQQRQQRPRRFDEDWYYDRYDQDMYVEDDDDVQEGMRYECSRLSAGRGAGLGGGDDLYEEETDLYEMEGGDGMRYDYSRLNGGRGGGGLGGRGGGGLGGRGGGGLGGRGGGLGGRGGGLGGRGGSAPVPAGSAGGGAPVGPSGGRGGRGGRGGGGRGGGGRGGGGDGDGKGWWWKHRRPRWGWGNYGPVYSVGYPWYYYDYDPIVYNVVDVAPSCNPSGTQVWVPFENQGRFPDACSLGGTDEEVQFNMQRIAALANCCTMPYLPDGTPCLPDPSSSSATAARQLFSCR